jgi:hypothetical protein
MSFQDLVIPELINNISLKCDLSSLYKLRLVSNEIKNMIDINTMIILKMKEIIPSFFHKYINFSSNFMLNSRYINIGDKCGMTGYIDFIQPIDFINENYNTNIIYGHDSIERFFISILYTDQLANKQKIVSFFQRYSTDSRYYVSCQNSFIYSTMCATFRFSNNPTEKLTEIYEILFKLMNEGIAESTIESDEKYSYKLIIP